jgi:hypothetical protein
MADAEEPEVDGSDRGLADSSGSSGAGRGSPTPARDLMRYRFGMTDTTANRPSLSRAMALIVLALVATACGKNPESAKIVSPGFRVVASETEDRIDAVWLDATNTLWVTSTGDPAESGATHSVRCLSGGEWTSRSEGLVAGAMLIELQGNDSGALLAGDLGRIWQFLDGAWKPLLSTGDPDPFRFHLASDGTVTAVCAYYPRFLRFKLDDPDHAEIGPIDGALGDVWAFGPDHVVSAPIGRGGVPLHYSGGDWGGRSAWRDLPLPEAASRREIEDIWSPDGESLLAVGGKGLVLRLENDAWSVEETPTTERLLSVWGDAADRCVAVGENGTVLHHDGSGWKLLDPRTKAHLRSVRGRPGDRMFIGGAGGTLLELVLP